MVMGRKSEKVVKVFEAFTGEKVGQVSYSLGKS